MIWHEHVSSIAAAAGKKLGYLFRARKYFSPSNLLTLYKAQIRPSLKYCSHIWGAAAPTTLSILDAVQRRAIRLIGDPALACHLQPLSHRRAVGDLSPFYRYSNGFCSSETKSTHTRPVSEAGAGQAGASDRPDDDPSNDMDHFRWTTEMKDDLLSCREQQSSPHQRALHNIKRSFKMADLKREDAAVNGHLSENLNIWCNNCKIYAEALRLTR
nr:unnamed protein product [Callosobruchus chinensis]